MSSTERPVTQLEFRETIQLFQRAIEALVAEGDVKHPGLRTMTDWFRSKLMNQSQEPQACSEIVKWLASHAEGGQVSPESRILARALAIGMLQSMQDSPEKIGDTRFWLFADEVLRWLPRVRRVFHRRAQHCAKRHPEFVPRLADFVSFRLQCWGEGTDTLAVFSRDLDTKAIAQQWKLAPDFRELFDGSKLQGHFHWFWDQAFELLFRIAPSAALKILNKAPHPVIATHILEPYQKPNRFAECLELCRIAPSAFDREGNFNGGCAAPVLAGALVHNLRQHISKTGSGGLLPHKAVVFERLEQFCKALAARPDSVGLGYALLQHILWQTGSRGYWSSWRGDDQENRELFDLVRLLVSEIAKRLSPLKSAEMWVMQEGQLYRDLRSAAVIAVALEKTETTVPRELRDTRELSELLLLLAISGKIDPISWSQTLLAAVDKGPQAKGLLLHIPGCAVASLSDPAQWFRAVWRKSYWVRNRLSDVDLMGFSEASGNKIAQNCRRGDAAKIPLSWGLVALSFIHTDDPRGCALWCEVETAARECRIQGRSLDDGWELTVEVLAAHWPRLFADAEDCEGQLKTFLGGHAGMNKGYFRVLDQLLRQGISAGQLYLAHPERLGPLALFVETATRLDALETEDKKEFQVRKMLPPRFLETLALG